MKAENNEVKEEKSKQETIAEALSQKQTISSSRVS